MESTPVVILVGSLAAVFLFSPSISAMLHKKKHREGIAAMNLLCLIVGFVLFITGINSVTLFGKTDYVLSIGGWLGLAIMVIGWLGALIWAVASPSEKDLRRCPHCNNDLPRPDVTVCPVCREKIAPVSATKKPRAPKPFYHCPTCKANLGSPDLPRCPHCNQSLLPPGSPEPDRAPPASQAPRRAEPTAKKPACPNCGYFLPHDGPQTCPRCKKKLSPKR